jgi:hypothetical protein
MARLRRIPGLDRARDPGRRALAPPVAPAAPRL